MSGEPDNETIEMELLRGVLEVGDNAAWKAFFRHFDRRIYRCITKVTALFQEVNRADVEEIRGDVNLRLLERDKRKLRKFDPERGTKLGSWVGMLAINATYDYLRKLERRPVFTNEATWLADDGRDPFECTASQEALERLDQALAQLSERDQLFVRLYQLEERPAEEVAESLGISTSTIYSKMFKIREKLQSVKEEL